MANFAGITSQPSKANKVSHVVDHLEPEMNHSWLVELQIYTRHSPFVITSSGNSYSFLSFFLPFPFYLIALKSWHQLLAVRLQGTSVWFTDTEQEWCWTMRDKSDLVWLALMEIESAGSAVVVVGNTELDSRAEHVGEGAPLSTVWA